MQIKVDRRGLLRMSLTALVPFLAVAFAIFPALAQPTYDTRQLEYLFTGTTVHVDGVACQRSGIKPGTAIIEFKFQPNGILEFTESCTYKGTDIANGRGRGGWLIQDYKICLSPPADVAKREIESFYSKPYCWSIVRWRFGFSALNDKEDVDWQMTLTAHPKHQSKEDLWSALGAPAFDLAEMKRRREAEAARQKAEAKRLAELEQRLKAEAERLAELKRTRETEQAQRKSETERSAKLQRGRKSEEARKKTEAERIARVERERKAEMAREKAEAERLEIARRTQKALQGLGLYSGALDGIIGARTQAAIEAWQERNDDLVTGTLTSDQLSNLERQAVDHLAELADQRKEAEAKRRTDLARARRTEEARKKVEAERIARSERDQKAQESREKANAERVAKATETKIAERSIGVDAGVRQQLELLTFLHEQGLISQQEFDEKREAMINRALGLSSVGPKKEVKKVATGPYAHVDFGHYYALVIGNNHYKYLRSLTTAESDARAVARTLKEDYGFVVTLLVNATRGQIIEALDEFREELTQNSNLLIYYAGHGWLDEDTDRGYWLPVNARLQRRSDWLSNVTVTDAIKAIRAKHIMVVADSCYSGTLTRGLGGIVSTGDYVDLVVKKKARVAITSGGLEPVADLGGDNHSPFAKAFLTVLRNNADVLDGTRLFRKMRRPIKLATDQTPQYSDIRKAGHEGGDFLFVRQR